MATNTSQLQQAIETIEALSTDELAVLLEIIQKRLVQQQREQLLRKIVEAEQDSDRENVESDSAGDFLVEVENFLLRIAPRSRYKKS